jgi:hypothetical protein
MKYTRYFGCGTAQLFLILITLIFTHTMLSRSRDINILTEFLYLSLLILYFSDEKRNPLGGFHSLVDLLDSIVSSRFITALENKREFVVGFSHWQMFDL